MFIHFEVYLKIQSQLCYAMYALINVWFVEFDIKHRLFVLDICR